MHSFSRANDRLWSWVNGSNRRRVNFLRLLLVILVAETAFLGVISFPLHMAGLPYESMAGIFVGGYAAAVGGMLLQLLLNRVIR